MLWQDEAHVQLDYKIDNIICCMIKDVEDNLCYRLYGCYGPSTYKRKCSFWEEMGIRIQNEILPWIMFGDLNEVIDNSEKLGGRGLRNKRLFLSNFV